MPRFFALIALSLLCTFGAQASDDKYCFNGYAYSEDGATLLYTEHHEQSRVNGLPIDWTVVYRSANADVMGIARGEVIARKQFDFSDNGTVPVYTLDIPKEGYREGIRHDDKGWRMIRRKSADAVVETEPFKYKQPIAADSGFDPFVKQNFDALMAGETVKFDYVAAGRLGVIGLRASKVGNTTINGKPAVKFRAELDSLLRFVVDSLVMTYDPESKKILQYEGVSNLHRKEGDTFPVLIKYLDKAPEAAKGSNTPDGCMQEG